MTFSRIKWDVIVILLLLVLAIGLGVTVKLQSSSNARLNEQKNQLQREKASAEAITNNILKSTQLFNDIARAIQNDKQASHAESDRRVVVIRKLVKGNSCAAEPVPHHAADQLREHIDKLRSDSASADSGNSAG
ncbi:hypothetical protein QNA27_11705 [Pantoea eucalypti]|uniref:hypothetical protein n=1 Tax=Pantoea eucalypti TaxID=470933 RepID=UPI0024B98703|nr:hypothetical protein [Pantoea eucalypti]MDJ0474322.1 hypothetical protein [Pantoea eucalypti]